METVARQAPQGGNGDRLVLRPQAPLRLRGRAAIAATMIAGVALLTVAVIGTGNPFAEAAMAVVGTLTLTVAAAVMAAARR